MVPPVPTQGVIIDREFSRGSLDRCARRQQPLDPHALEVIAREPLCRAIDFSKYKKKEVPFICDLRSSNSELKHKIVAR